MASGKNRAYRLHTGHYLRDIITIIAYLEDSPDIEGLINNLPHEIDMPVGDN